MSTAVQVKEPIGRDRFPANGTPHFATAEEFLQWLDEDTLAEWRNGETIMMTPASLRHQDLVGFLAVLLRLYVQQYALGRVIEAPFPMRMKASVREPDILFVAREHVERLKATHLEGGADLVVEVISPESVGRDRGEKFYEYEEAGVCEYWLIDPQREVLEVYEREGERFRLAFMEHVGRYESRVLRGFWVEAEWFWQDPLPPVLEVLKALKVI